MIANIIYTGARLGANAGNVGHHHGHLSFSEFAACMFIMCGVGCVVVWIVERLYR